jgi:hypothetical protein
MTTLKQLRTDGGFVSDKPVKKTITYKTHDDEGEQKEYTYDIFVKRLCVDDYEALYLTGEARSQSAAIISHTITLGDDGKEKIDFKLACSLHPALAGAMILAFNEVNGAKKSSARATDSSAN